MSKRKPKVQLYTQAPLRPTEEPQKPQQSSNALMSLIGSYSDSDSEQNPPSPEPPQPPPLPPSAPSDPPVPVAQPPEPATSDLDEFLQEIGELVETEKPSPSPASTEQDNGNSQKELWQECLDVDTGNVYFWNTETNEVTWTRPAELGGGNLEEDSANELIQGKFMQNTEIEKSKSHGDKFVAEEARKVPGQFDKLKAACLILTEKALLLAKKDAPGQLDEAVVKAFQLSGRIFARQEDWNEHGTNLDVLLVVRRIAAMTEELFQNLDAINLKIKKIDLQKSSTEFVKKAPKLYNTVSQNNATDSNRERESLQPRPTTTTTTAAATRPLEAESDNQKQNTKVQTKETNASNSKKSQATTTTTTTPPSTGWVAILEPSTQQFYYHNYSTGQTQWEPPKDFVPEQSANPPLPQEPEPDDDTGTNDNNRSSNSNNEQDNHDNNQHSNGLGARHKGDAILSAEQYPDSPPPLPPNDESSNRNNNNHNHDNHNQNTTDTASALTSRKRAAEGDGQEGPKLKKSANAKASHRKATQMIDKWNQVKAGLEETNTGANVSESSDHDSPIHDEAGSPPPKADWRSRVRKPRSKR